VTIVYGIEQPDDMRPIAKDLRLTVKQTIFLRDMAHGVLGGQAKRTASSLARMGFLELSRQTVVLLDGSEEEGYMLELTFKGQFAQRMIRRWCERPGS